MKGKVVLKELVLMICVLMLSAANVQSQTFCEDEFDGDNNCVEVPVHQSRRGMSKLTPMDGYCNDYTCGMIFSTGAAGECFKKGCEASRSGDFSEVVECYAEASTCKEWAQYFCYSLGMAAGVVCGSICLNPACWFGCMIATEAICWVSGEVICEIIDTTTSSTTTTIEETTTTDDFENGVIDTMLWVVDGAKRGCGPPCGSNTGNWNISNNEIVDPVDGYLNSRVWGPTSGNTYGAEAWVRTSYDFNDGSNYTINFTWEPDFADFHYNYFFIQVTDGYVSPVNNLHWNLDSYPGTVNLLRNTNGTIGKNYENESSPGKLNWSITIDSSGIASLYEGPNATGTLHYQTSLDSAYPWYIRFMVSDGTSAGFPGGDAWLNLYDFTALP